MAPEPKSGSSLAIDSSERSGGPTFAKTASFALFGSEKLRADIWSLELESLGFATSLFKKTAVPIYQVVKFENDLSVSALLPTFEETTFDVVKLKDVSLTYQVRKVLCFLSKK